MNRRRAVQQARAASARCVWLNYRDWDVLLCAPRRGGPAVARAANTSRTTIMESASGSWCRPGAGPEHKRRKPFRPCITSAKPPAGQHCLRALAPRLVAPSGYPGLELGVSVTIVQQHLTEAAVLLRSPCAELESAIAMPWVTDDSEFYSEIQDQCYHTIMRAVSNEKGAVGFDVREGKELDGITGELKHHVASECKLKNHKPAAVFLGHSQLFRTQTTLHS